MSKTLFVQSVASLFVMIFVAATGPLPARAASQDYSKLQMLNLDEMKTQVDQKLSLAHSQMDNDETKDAAENLRDALKLILSRPNGDNMVAQLLPPVRSKLKDLGSFEDVLTGLADEAIFALTQGKEAPTRKATNVFVLENILSEFKPDVKTNKAIERIFIKIRDAKIAIPSEVSSDLRLRGMFKSKVSPSQMAEKIIGIPPKGE